MSTLGTSVSSTDGTTFTLSSGNNSVGAITAASTSTSITNTPSYGPCIHGTYGPCTMCYPGYSQTCICNMYGSICPMHASSIINIPTVSTPGWTTWPPSPPPVDLHAKEGHSVTHEIVTDEKGLKIVFKCSFCSEVIYKKYIVRIPRKVKEEKCLVRVLNHR